MAEVSRDVAVPDHCVVCGRPHAALAIPLRTLFLQVAPGRFRREPGLKKHYVFRFCPECARAVRRRRTFGLCVLWSGVFLFLFAMFEPLAAITHDWNWPVTQAVMTFGMLGGTVMGYGGLWLRIYLPQVRPIDYGGEKVFFRFQNQVFRNHFAQLNGEE